MPEPYVLTALYRKYAEILGEMRQAEDRTQALRADLAHLEATIRLFKADDFNPDAISPKRRNKPSRWLRRGQGIQTALEVLKDAKEPLTARQIAVQVMQRRGITDRDRQTVKSIANTIRTTFAARLDHGIIVHDTHPRRWEIDHGEISRANDGASANRV